MENGAIAAVTVNIAAVTWQLAVSLLCTRHRMGVDITALGALSNALYQMAAAGCHRLSALMLVVSEM